jgi:NAD+ synthase (glutamine-hydrolysing)
VKLALLQFNATVGDLDGNVRAIADMARRAFAQGARVAVAPELALTGYPPEDLLLRPAFMQACATALQGLAAAVADCEGLHLVVGHPHRVMNVDGQRGKSLMVQSRFNAASLLTGGRVVGTYCKRELPNYQVFDERRYFVSGRDAGLGPLVFEVDGMKLGVLICEDAWFDEPGAAAKAAGAQALLVLNASPFHIDKAGEREQRMAERAQTLALPLAYAHLVGGQDEVVFDGASFAVDKSGAIVARAAAFEAELLLVDVDPDGTVLRSHRWSPRPGRRS